MKPCAMYINWWMLTRTNIFFVISMQMIIIGYPTIMELQKKYSDKQMENLSILLEV